MAKHLQSMLLACVLTPLLISAPAVQAQSGDLCEQVFSQIKSNEPILSEEMDDLQSLCKLDMAQSGPAYWQCVDGYLAARSYDSDNLILAGHLCVTAEQISQLESTSK